MMHAKGFLRRRILIGVLPCLMGACGGRTAISETAYDAGTDAQTVSQNARDARIEAQTSQRTDASEDMESGATLDAMDEGAFDAAHTEGGACFLQLSNYDQSCEVDSDCVAVAGLSEPGYSVDLCQEQCLCNNYAINGAARPQYIVAFGQTPAGGVSQGCEGEINACVTLYGPCCREGMCQTGSACNMPSGDAGGDQLSDAHLSMDSDVLCALNFGPMAPSTTDAGPALLCTGGEFCSIYNSGWHCCFVAGGATICVNGPYNDSGDGE
jgi:hypothetical protein